jgi:AcrR family transcriptional regulator
VYANFGGKEELLLAIVDELAVQEDAWFEQWSGADLGTALAGSGDDLTRTLLSLEVFTYGVRHPGARAAIAPTVLRSWERAAALVHRQRTGEDGPVEQEDRDLALAAISVHTYAAIFARLVGAEHGAEEAGARAVERLLGS